MRTIRNNSTKPLAVPLPHGKTLHLGPGKTGQISFQAADHPPLQKLIAEGDLEFLGEGPGQEHGPAGNEKVRGSKHGHHPGSTSRQLGDR
jgi:hypothetical protein